MKKQLLSIGAILLAPSLAIAHVSVQPRESKPGAEEQYTVRVPTEGTVATTHVTLEIPSELTVIEVLSADGATFETAKQGARITSITWRKEIPPKATAEFRFRARNPVSGEIVWKAHQHFSDGTIADWIGVAGDRRPASVTKLIAQALQPADRADGNGVTSFTSFLFMRQQSAISDRQFLRSMIPHHSGAILMCEEAPIRDPRIKDLCNED
jgi:uncharacterized protein YcnI